MRRYGVVTALLYDVFSGERPFYRPGRVAAVEALRLCPGDGVLVLGCGTGLDLPLIARAIGPTGTLIAVDESPVMLHTAGRRFRRQVPTHAPELRLVQADLTRARGVLPPGVAPVDAVLAVNTLTLIPDWKVAWRRGVAAARPGARVAIADIGLPTAPSAGMSIWARVIALIGGSKLAAAPWTAIDADAHDVRAASFWRGHVQLRAGILA